MNPEELPEETYAGVVEAWDSFPESFRISDADESVPTENKPTDAGVVTTWDLLQIHREKIRTHIVYVFLALLVMWVFAGFIAFFTMKNNALLITAPLLAEPVTFMTGYYFGTDQSKKEKE